MAALPEPHTPEMYQLEERANSRARELLHEKDGRIHDALFELEQELRRSFEDDYVERRRPDERPTDGARTVARQLSTHVEQCWATRILA